MQESFILNSQALENFINSMPHPAYINNIDTGECIFSNKSSKHFLNIENCLGYLSTDNEGEPDLCKARSCNEFNLNAKLLVTGKTVNETGCVAFDKKGRACFHDITKIPVLDNTGKISAVFTLRLNHKEKISFVKLYQVYKANLKNKRKSVNMTMEHLSITDSFEEQLTEKELLCLLHMKIDTSHKYLMNQLCVSKKTIESHISHLLKKAKENNLSSILAKLRHS